MRGPYLRLLRAGAFAFMATNASIPLSADTASIPLTSLPPNTRYAIWGDSITEVTLYPKFIEAYLLMCAGRKDISCFTLGHSGEEAGGLISRESDLKAFRATLVSFDWGMNDTAYNAYTDQKGTGYDQNTRASIALLIKNGVSQRVVVSPSYVDDTYTADPKAFFGPAGPQGMTVAQGQNVTLGHFRDIARKAAVDTNSAFADVYNRMKDSYLLAEKANGPTYTFGIHVTPNGAILIAHEILKTLACDGNIGTVDVDMKGAAKASAGHTVVNSVNGVVVLDSAVYPFCSDYDPAVGEGPIGIESMLPYLPFNQELNRFTLKVTNLGAPGAAVTWGSETKQFTSDQLAQGVNLPAEFKHTPFDATFAKVMAAILRKQDYEDFVIKGTSNYFGNDNGGNVDTNMIAVEGELDAALKALVVPVRHSIVIVPTGAAPGAPAITGTLMAYAATGQSFTYQISALNSPTSFSATGLPDGLSLDAKSGQITGTPSAAGTAKVALSASNAAGDGTATLVLTTSAPIPPRPEITSPKTATATVGAPFSYQTVATNSPTHYFATTPSDKGTEPPDSSLPPGITYDSATGLVSGTPTKAGSFVLQVAAMNEGGISALQVALTIKDK